MPKLDAGARASADSFLRKRQGDVLLAWENEACLATHAAQGRFAVELVYPAVSIRAEPPVTMVDAVVEQRGTRELAEEYLRFLYSEAAQVIMDAQGYRPQARVSARLPDFPRFSVAEICGGWGVAEEQFFAPNALFDQILRGKA